MGLRRDGSAEQPGQHRLQVVAPIQATGELSEIAGTVFLNAKAWTVPESADLQRVDPMKFRMFSGLGVMPGDVPLMALQESCEPLKARAAVYGQPLKRTIPAKLRRRARSAHRLNR